MTTTVPPTPVTGNFIDFLYGFIKPEEAFIPRVYTDGVGVPTLGVGYALVIYDSAVTHSWVLRPNLATELSAINVTLSLADMAVLQEVADVLNTNPPAPGQHASPVAVAAIDLLIPPPQSGEFAGNLALSASLNPFQDVNLISIGDGRTLFGNVIPQYISYVRTRLGIAPGSAFDTSQEMAALVSMAYTGYTIITKDLVAALNLPDASQVGWAPRAHAEQMRNERHGGA